MEIQVVAFLALLFVSEVMSEAAVGTKCPVLFDGRIPRSYAPSDLVRSGGKYGSPFIEGYAKAVTFPSVLPSMWDYPAKAKPVELTINDKSFYSPKQPQYKSTFLQLITPRTADLGTTTFHLSIRNDPTRPLNFSHLYQAAFHVEYNDKGSQYKLLIGTPYNGTSSHPQSFRVAGKGFNQIFFETPFYFDMWHNFAITVGWTTNTLTVYYSTNYSPLQKVAGPGFNDNSGPGVFYVGPFKFPTGGNNINIALQGYQEPNINEGLIFGGIFIEDSSGGCVSTWTQP